MGFASAISIILFCVLFYGCSANKSDEQKSGTIITDTTTSELKSNNNDTSFSNTDSVFSEEKKTEERKPPRVKKEEIAEEESIESSNTFEGNINGYKFFSYKFFVTDSSVIDTFPAEEIISARRSFEFGYSYEYYSNDQIANPIPDKVIVKADFFMKNKKRQFIKSKHFLVTRSGEPMQEVIPGSDGVCGPMFRRVRTPNDMSYTVEEIK